MAIGVSISTVPRVDVRSPLEVEFSVRGCMGHMSSNAASHHLYKQIKNKG